MSVEEGGDESLPAGIDAPMAQPKKIVDLMAREADEGLMPIESGEAPITFTLDVPRAMLTRSKCEWEQCSEPAVVKMKWRREKYNGRDDAFDYANYCDGHATMAQPLGATLLEKL